MIETPRLQIRAFRASDAQALSGILGDPPVMEYSSTGPLTERGTRDFIARCIGSYRKHGFGQWAVVEKASDALIGCCGLSHAVVDGVEEVEIGYRLSRDRWGKGLASEAAQAVLDYGFEVCHLASIVGIVAPRHSASVRVLEKIGFQHYSLTWYKGWEVRIYRTLRA